MYQFFKVKYLIFLIRILNKFENLKNINSYKCVFIIDDKFVKFGSFIDFLLLLIYFNCFYFPQALTSICLTLLGVTVQINFKILLV